MKNLRGFALGLALGLAAAISTVGIAQDTKQADQGKTVESCCAMESCCGGGDSCSLKHGAKDHSAKDGCCCCGADSCDMKMKARKNQE